MGENVELAEKYLSANEKVRTVDTGTPGSTAGGSGNKKKAGKSDAEKAYEREQKAYEKWIRNQREKIAMLGVETEADKIRVEIQLGNYAKLTEAQRQNMIATAQMVDMAQDAYEVQKKYDEIIGKDTIKDQVFQIEALSQAWNNGKLSIDAYRAALIGLQVDASNKRLEAGVGSSTDLARSSLSGLLGDFKSVQASAAESFSSMGASLSDGFSNGVGQAIVYSENLGDSLKDVAKSAVADLISAFVKLGIQIAAQAALGDTLTQSSAAKSAAAGGEVAAAWGPAAIATSVASFGSNTVLAIAGITAALALLPMLLGGFATGGYTGNGGKYEPKGIVHGGEYVFSKQRVNEIGLANLERLHSGYADGSFMKTPDRRVASIDSGAGTGDIRIVNNTSANIGRAEQTTDSAGNRVIRLSEIDDAVANAMNNPSSRTSRSMKNNFNTRRKY